ncbi:MAG: DUF2726 domain-containing protein [Lachnospiraceae bacterium]|nr:DUF2726 domain-containing protein [Lachnospiraceae bacterium]
MNVEKVMILIRGVDKTAEISWIADDLHENRREVTYKSGRSYPYKPKNVVVIENPRKIELSGNVAYERNIPIYKPQCILDFGKYVRIIEHNGKIINVHARDFSIVPNGIKDEQVKDILEYFKKISQYISHKDSKEYGEGFLRREMEQITYVHPESVLYAYLKQEIREENKIDNRVIFPFCFNISQKQALENALSNSISIIKGPPGTGKTQTILNIIANLVVIQEKSVAVVANNNEAVKNVLEKMENKGYGFLFAFLGSGKNQDVFFNHMPEIHIEEWDCQENIETLMQQVKMLNIKLNSLLELDRERKKLQQQKRAWILEQKHFMKYYEGQNISEISDFPLFSETSDTILSFMAETSLVVEQNLLRRFLWRLKNSFRYGVFNYNKLRVDEKELFLMLQKEFYNKYIANLEEKINNIVKKLQYENFADINKQHQKISEKLFRKFLYERYSNIIDYDFTKKNYKPKYKKFLERYPVILSTTHSLRHSIPRNYLFDYVIIDEASQVDLITGVLVCSCCKNLIIVGDEAQLPQIIDTSIMQKTKSVIINEKYNYFRNSVLTSFMEIYGDRIPCKMLYEHYRCHPQIIEFCNQKYYGGKLIAYTDESLSKNPLIVYKTVPGNHMRHVTRGNDKGRYNQREIDVIKEEVLREVQGLESTDSIGIVTPYRKQANKISESLPSFIESDTVHKYQGREKDIMIMSTVLDTTWDGISGVNFVDDSHMINVAVSRAIKQFILVTNQELFFYKGKEIGDLIRYIHYNTLDKNIIESNVISVFDLLYKEYSPKLNDLKQKMKKNARYQSEEVIRVLLDEIFLQSEYGRFNYSQGVLLCNILKDTELLSKKELRFVNHRASLDFVIFCKQDKKIVLVIEVDGFAFHENNPRQLARDALKDGILQKYGIPIIRLATNKSGEKEKIEKALSEVW